MLVVPVFLGSVAPLYVLFLRRSLDLGFAEKGSEPMAWALHRVAGQCCPLSISHCFLWQQTCHTECRRSHPVVGNADSFSEVSVAAVTVDNSRNW